MRRHAVGRRRLAAVAAVALAVLAVPVPPPSGARVTIAPTLIRATDACSTRPVGSPPASGAVRSAVRTARMVRVGGTRRRYVVSVPRRATAPAPASEPATAALPVILAFHGWASSPERLERQSALAAEGAALGFVVVMPQGSGSPARWALPGRLAGGDDLAFVDVILRDVASRTCIDRTRLYAAGFSNGAAFTGRLSCERPGTFRAVALVAGAGIGTPCPSAPPVPALLVQSPDDPVIRLGGGTAIGGRLRVAPFDAAVRDWRRRDAGAAPVDVVLAAGVGHVWPRTPMADATALVLREFASAG